MSAIDILVPANAVRRIHFLVAERLAELGYDTALVGIDVPNASPMLDTILSAERKILRTSGNDLFNVLSSWKLSASRAEAVLRIDLTESGQVFAGPVLEPRFNGCASVASAAAKLMQGRLPEIDIVLDGSEIVGHAAPMVDSRLSLARGLDDVLARLLTLLVYTADRHLKSTEDVTASRNRSVRSAGPTAAQLISAYVFWMMPRQLAGAVQRCMFNIHRWDTYYRFHKGVQVGSTGSLAGEPWTILPDGGNRFYADPFSFDWNGRHFIFVEDFADGDRKAVISVAEVFSDGRSTVPRTVIEEPHHLSYPQVFSRDGEIWMLPESAAGGALVLYRAETFPDRWVRHSVLVPDRALFDATLLEHEGRLWLFASERDTYGSAADTLVVYYADGLDGEWTPHRGNPLRIDRAAARPGGGFIGVGNRLVLPLQDGTQEYGAGLGLASLLELNEDTVRLAAPVPIPSCNRAISRIHTLNSSEHLEVIDCKVPRFRWSLKSQKRLAS